MRSTKLEHVNVTVTDPEATAALLAPLFGWRVRWSGPSRMGGRTVHLGSDDSYLALWTPGDPAAFDPRGSHAAGGLSHVGVEVDDLEAVEARVRAAGLEPSGHDNYDPGRRFYFRDRDGIEYEVVSYG